MLKSKSVWLPLALPLLLIGCGDNYGNITSESAVPSPRSQSVETNEAPQTASAQEESEPDIQLEIREDQVEQVDTINDTLDNFPVLEIDALESETNVEGQTNAAVSEAQANSTLNGEYSYEVSYATPPGTTELTVTFALTNNTINQVRLVGNPQHSTSLQYQKKIEDELGNLIVGKELSNVEPLPSRSAGSSLTPTAFNEALAQLQAEA